MNRNMCQHMCHPLRNTSHDTYLRTKKNYVIRKDVGGTKASSELQSVWTPRCRLLVRKKLLTFSSSDKCSSGAIWILARTCLATPNKPLPGSNGDTVHFPPIVGIHVAILIHPIFLTLTIGHCWSAMHSITPDYISKCHKNTWAIISGKIS